jgi:predicted nucleic acid-binding protein
MTIYAESSAVLAWLLDDGPDGLDIAATLEQATTAIASDLTLIECDRVLSRAAALVERARRPFPQEPIRTLDAIHLATALAARRAVPHLKVLTLDRRVRRTARAMRFALIPSDDAPGAPRVSEG